MLSIADTPSESGNWEFPRPAGAPEAFHARGGERRARRLTRFARRAERMREVEDDAPEQIRWRFESCRSVLPEDLLFGNTMFAGKLLLDIDEAGGILSMRYCRGLVMTACLDALDFYAPVHANEVVTFQAGLNHVGTSSLEIGGKGLSEGPWTGEIKHACTAYLSLVHLGSDPSAPLRPRPCRPFTPETPAERRRWTLALERRARRLGRVKTLKLSLSA